MPEGGTLPGTGVPPPGDVKLTYSKTGRRPRKGAAEKQLEALLARKGA